MCFHCRRSVLLLAVFLLFCLPSYAQDSSGGREKTVHGTVVDESGEPVIGCAVYQSDNVGGGVATNVDGVFVIKVSQDVTELVFEALGYEKVTLPVDKVRRVRLRSESQKLDDVVVTGIFTRKKDSFTGSVQTISSEEIKRVSNSNVVQALKNLDPSLLVLENLEAGSNPNAMASMQLRGASTFAVETSGLKSNFLNDANVPLFILDGFETSLEKITDMDMNRIQSITILKDASAKAIYGSKGANGVIVVETKSLNNEHTLITYTGNLALEAPDLTSYNLCNSLEKLEVEYREGMYTGVRGNVDSKELVALQHLYNDRLRRALEGEDNYWLSKPLRIGIGQKHTLEAELGGKDLRALLNVSYNDVQGVMKESFRDILTAQANVSYRRGKWTFRNIMDIASMSSSESPWGSFSEYALMNPYDSPYDDEGNLVKAVWPGVYTSPEGYSTSYRSQYPVGNPMWNARVGMRDTGEYLNFTDNLYAELQLFTFLKIVGRFGIDTKRTGYETFKPADHTDFLRYTSADDLLRRGSYSQTRGTSTTISGDVSAQFSRTFNKLHDLFATGQYSISSRSYSEVQHTAEGFPNSHMSNIYFARQYAMGTTPTGYDGIYRDIGFLLTVGYSYDNRYMADATFRASGATVFGTNNRWGLFWSIGAAWNLHNEDFLKGAASWLQQLKLRGSVGSSGNQNYSVATSLPVYNYFSSKYYNGFAGASLSNMANPYLGWEEKLEYNIGLDFRAKRITATLDAYLADTRNLLFARSLVPSTGFSTVQDNMGVVRNRGLELSLGYTIYQHAASYVTVFGRFAFNDNRVLKISEAIEEYNRQQQANAKETGANAPVIQYYDGVPLHSIWAVRSLGVNPLDGQEIFLDRDGNMTDTWDPADLVNCGSSDPVLTGNFGVNGEVKGIGFNVTFRVQAGGYLYNNTLLQKVEGADIVDNVDRRLFLGRWAGAGSESQFLNGFKNGIVGNVRTTSRFVQRNNQLNVSAMSLYYEFPARWIASLHMRRLRLSFNTNDLYTFSSIDIERGTSYPYARTFTFSLTATF